MTRQDYHIVFSTTLKSCFKSIKKTVFVKLRSRSEGLGGGLGEGLDGGVGGGLDGGLQRGLLTGYGRGLAVKLRSGKVQVRSGPGLVQFTAQI